jgi:hypothetical protein
MKDPIGIVLSWSGVIDAFFYAFNEFIPMDHWIDRMDYFLAGSPVIPVPDVEILLTSRMIISLRIFRFGQKRH